MKFIKTTQENATEEMRNILDNKIKGLALINYATAPMVEKPAHGFLDEQLCNDMGYTIVDFRHTGGVIVSEAGDIQFAHFGDANNGFREKFANGMVEWLIKKGLEAEYTGNDILVYGKKVCGIGVTCYFNNNFEHTGIHVSINVNLENIKKICMKPMEKVPAGLGQYGITAQDVCDFFMDLCENCD